MRPNFMVLLIQPTPEFQQPNLLYLPESMDRFSAPSAKPERVGAIQHLLYSRDRSERILRHMSLLARPKTAVSNLLLRGRVLDAWLQRKMRKVESRYLRELLRGSTGPQAPQSLSAARPRTPLRRILFISDVQWENKELLPELRKICPVDCLNAHPDLLRRHSPADDPAIFAGAVRKYIQENASSTPDLVFLYAHAGLLSEEVFELIRKKWSCPLIGMNLDDKVEFLDYGLFSYRRDNYQQWAPRFDLNISNVRAVVDWYADRKWPVYYMPEGYHDRHAPPVDGEFRYELSFVGSWRPERARLFSQLQELGLPIEPVGWGWPNSEAGNHPERVYRSSRMNLGIGFASPSQTLTTLKTRDFECPGSGACFLTTYNWELALHYEIGREILCYRSIEELVEIFSFYRRRPEECLKIARAAYARCQRDHTWERRFRGLFAEMGFSIAAS
jgi:hypothetical protein